MRVAALPPAINITMLAERFGADAGRIARVVMVVAREVTGRGRRMKESPPRRGAGRSAERLYHHRPPLSWALRTGNGVRTAGDR